MKIQSTAWVLGLVAALTFAWCKGEQQVAGEQPADRATPEPARPDAITINGAGATFPYPIYSQWADTYHKVSGVKLNYQSIGSGGGIAQIEAKTVDFGASDAPLKAEELDAHGLVQFPMVMGGVVPVVNIAGVEPGQLTLSGALLADIFLGKVKKWSDKGVRKENPELALPDADISIVHRADGSGTTWIFTNYLDKVSPAWHEKVGTGKAVAWPAGMGGKGNEGVAAYVQRMNGAIGYVEYAYALQNGMAHAGLVNRAGKVVMPTVESFQAAAASADWASAKGFYMVLTDQPGDASWPITGASFILVHKEQPDAARAKAMLGFFDWCYAHGADQAKALHYVPLPDQVVDLVKAAWRDQVKAGGGPVL
ncbi:MAG: phosphate ABC transporter substrate-binding protein PstS [Deltaproteobacteria bacterium]|nr:phosphate ABC transporter substrate-binding protein PstS [Deltaproteobacteria bacterium]